MSKNTNEFIYPCCYHKKKTVLNERIISQISYILLVLQFIELNIILELFVYLGKFKFYIYFLISILKMFSFIIICLVDFIITVKQFVS